MKLNLKNLEPAGFKSTALFPTKLGGGLFYRKKTDRVEYASTYVPQSLGVFPMTKAQLRQLAEGKLGLVPPGFCNPSGGKSLTNGRVIYTGEIRSLKQLEEIFAAVQLPSP